MGFNVKKMFNSDTPAAVDGDAPVVDTLADNDKSFWNKIWPVMACGAGLFSDGYINNVRSFSSSYGNHV